MVVFDDANAAPLQFAFDPQADRLGEGVHQPTCGKDRHGGSLPAGFGYDPSDAVTAPDVQTRLMIIYGCVPALMMAAGALFLRRFPITRDSHAEVRAALNLKTTVDRFDDQATA